MTNNKLGFTLTELLAVVLIIGILTAVGLPQYRRSVSRAEAMEALVNLRTIFDSAKRYKAAHSVAPNKLLGLDVSFFDATSETDPSFSIGKFTYMFDSQYISACRINGNYCFFFYYKHPGLGRDILTCKTITTGGKYDWLCENIGTRDLGEMEYLMDR